MNKVKSTGLILAICATLSASLQSADAPAISGAAYVERKSGDSIILRDLEIDLCKPSVVPLWDSTHTNTRTYMQFLGAHINFLQRLPDYIVTKTRTDIDGKFKFAAVSSGEYVIFAGFQTSGSTACWLMPIKVEPEKPIEINLTSSNAKEIRNQR